MKTYNISLHKIQRKLTKELIDFGSTNPENKDLEIQNLCLVYNNPSSILVNAEPITMITILLKQVQLMTGSLNQEIITKYFGKTHLFANEFSKYRSDVKDCLEFLITNSKGRSAIKTFTFPTIIPSTNLFHLTFRNEKLWFRTYNRSVDLKNYLCSDLSCYLFLGKLFQNALKAKELEYTHIIGTLFVSDSDKKTLTIQNEMQDDFKHLPLQGGISQLNHFADEAMSNFLAGKKSNEKEYFSSVVNYLLEYYV